MSPSLITVKEAAAILSVSTKTIYRMVAEGKIRRRAVGCGERTYRLLAIDVDTIIHPVAPSSYTKGSLRKHHTDR
jgi:excisionase family DNA binding protein